MNLKSIEYFLVVAEEMNITRAAERLYITQQALSGSIKRLEEEYGVQLFERRPSFHLTPEGEQMVFYGKQLLDVEANLKAAFSDVSQNHRGVLRVGMSRLRGSVFFPPIWKLYHSSHPNISVELVNANSATLESYLQDGKIDLYIGVNVAEMGSRERIELTQEKVHCCFTEELLQRYYPDTWREILASFREGADLTKIEDLPFITLRKGNRLRMGVDSFFSTHRMPQYLFECDQQELIYELAEKGDGAGLLSPVIFWQDTYKERASAAHLHVFPVVNRIPENVISLVHRTDYPLPHYALDFITDASMIFRSYSRAIRRQLG